jgi:poly-gamma-glutamate synthesis protein (capsule biosynthesis protein)
MEKNKGGIYMRRGRTRKTSSDISLNKNTPIIIIVVAIIIIIVSIISLILKTNETNKKALLEEQARQEELSKIFEESENTENTETTDEKEEVQHIKTSKVKIKIAGNILCENAILNDAYNAESNEYDFSTMFADIKDLITDSDITIGSLETNFYNENYSSHNSPTSLINAIKELKIETLNIANNQNLADGVDGLISTKKTLTEAGIDTYGTSISEEDSNILIKEVNNIKIAFLAYTTKIDDGTEITEEINKYINLYSEDKAKNDLAYVKEQGAEYICVNIHTGNSKKRLTTEEQEQINNTLIENGADLIIGTHQNALGKLEVRENSEGKNVLIVNSLGNLISENSSIGMILEVQIIRSEQTEGTILSKVVYTPIYTIDNGKNAKDRYKIVDIRSTVKIYENSDETIVSKSVYNKLKKALETVEKLIR